MSFHFTANLALGQENKISLSLGWHNSIRQLKAGREEINNKMSGECKASFSYKKES